MFWENQKRKKGKEAQASDLQQVESGRQILVIKGQLVIVITWRCMIIVPPHYLLKKNVLTRVNGIENSEPLHK